MNFQLLDNVSRPRFGEFIQACLPLESNTDQPGMYEAPKSISHAGTLFIEVLRSGKNRVGQGRNILLTRLTEFTQQSILQF